MNAFRVQRRWLFSCATAWVLSVVAGEEGCVDSTSWYKRSDPSKSCEWVSKHPPRCVVRGEDRSWAYESCQVSCGTCPTECDGDGDDSEWMTATGLGGCEWVQEFRQGRCDNVGMNGEYAFAACPVACRTCYVEKCSDDETWISAEGHTCEWVNQASKNRCSWLGRDGVYAFEACSAACDTCVEDCDVKDSEDFHKRGESVKDCAWVAQRPTPRCNVKGENGELAYEVCPVACNLIPMHCSEEYVPTYAPTLEDSPSPSSNDEATTPPTYSPTRQPMTRSPTYAPSLRPMTRNPTYAPTLRPTTTNAPVRTPTEQPSTTAAVPTYAPTYASSYSPTASESSGSPRLLWYVDKTTYGTRECESEITDKLKVAISEGSWSGVERGMYLLVARMQLSSSNDESERAIALSERWGHALHAYGSWGQSALAAPEFFDRGDQVLMKVANSKTYRFAEFSRVVGEFFYGCREDDCRIYEKESFFSSYSSAFFLADANFYSETVLEDDRSSDSSTLLTSDDEVPRDGVYWVSARVTALGIESESLIVEIAVNGVPTGYGINVVMRGDDEEVVGDVALALSLSAGDRLSLVDSGSEDSFEALEPGYGCMSSVGKTFITLVDLPRATNYGTAYVGRDSYETSVGERLVFDQEHDSSSLLDGDGTTFTAPKAGMYVASLKLSLDGSEEDDYSATFEVFVNGVGSGFAIEILAPEAGQFQFQQQMLVTPPLYLAKGHSLEVVTASTRGARFSVNGRSGDNDELDTFLSVVLLEEVDRDDDNCNVPDSKRHFLGDGYCDAQDPYNTEECGYDGGDCCSSTCVSGNAYVCGLGDRDACKDPEATHDPGSYPEECFWGDCYCDCDCDNGVENGCTDRRRLHAVDIDLL